MMTDEIDSEMARKHNFTSNNGIFQQNVRSLKKNIARLRDFIKGREEKFEIIGISEIWDIKNLNVNIDGYQTLIKESRTGTRTGYGGVGFYVRNNIVFRKIPDLSCIHSYIEAICIRLESGTFKNTFVLSVYRPEKYGDKDLFIEWIEAAIFKIKTLYSNKNIIVLGDMNSDDFNDELNSTMKNYGLIRTVNVPTRVTPTSATKLDTIFTTANCKGIAFEAQISDHYGCIAYKENSKPLQKTIEKVEIIRKRIFTKEEIEKLKQYILNNLDLQRLESLSAIKAFELFEKILNEAIIKNVSIKELKPSKSKPWFSKGLEKSRKKRLKLAKKSKDNPTNENIEKSKMYSKIYFKLIKKAQILYYEKRLNLNWHNTKMKWDILKELSEVDTYKKAHTNIIQINLEQKFITDKKQICNEFNKFFGNIGTKLAKNIKADKKGYKKLIEKVPRPENEHKFREVSQFEIQKIIKSLKPKRSCGPDLLPSWVLKEIYMEISAPLKIIINHCIKAKKIPKMFKHAKVLPLFKQGDQDNVNNFRPISLLPATSKVLEKVLNSQLIKFLNDNKIITPNQYGFQKNKSTQQLAMHFINEISQCKYEAVATFIDFSKAFDLVNRDLLIEKLKYYRIDYEIFVDYFKDRTQQVEINGIKSNTEKISLGVAQGSCISSTLFLIFINDLAAQLESPLLLFADDASLLTKATKENENIIQKANDDLLIIENWVKQNRLIMNRAKTKALIFNQKRSKHYDNLKIGNDKIEFVDKFKLVGFIIGKDLTWKEHIEYVIGKISSFLGILGRAKNFINENLRKLFFMGLVKPYINYGLIVWGCGNLKNLTTKLKKAVRIITGSSFKAHADPLFAKLKILKPNDQWHEEILKVSHQRISQNSLENIFPFHIPMRETRNNFENQLKVPNFSRKKFNNQICYLLPSIWNKELRKYYLPKRKQSVQMFREDILKKYSDFSCNDRRNCYSCNI